MPSSVRKFFDSPVWLITDYYQYIQKSRISIINRNSIATAKFAFLAESALNSFGGGKPLKPDIDKFLPFKENETGKIHLSQQTIDVFWDFIKQEKDLPEYIYQAFNEEELNKALDQGKQ